MRGRPQASNSVSRGSRNTPAYAGKTHILVIFDQWWEKHPRVCGEDSFRLCRLLPTWETPPRMRGRLKFSNAETHLMRNTPAYAGKTLCRPRAEQCRQKHPRVCGEDSYAPICQPVLRETPPRMRGRLGGTGKALRLRRNTPAYAGKTIPARTHSHLPQKHPRVCGEDTSFR